jgi:hypothetical protein
MLNPAVRILIAQLMKLRRASPAVVLLMVVFGSTIALAEEPKQPNLGFVDGSAVTLSPDRSDQFRLDIAMKNSGTKEGTLSLKLLSDMDKKCDQAKIAVGPDTPATLSPNGSAIAHVTILGVKPPATCYVTLATGQEQANTFKQVKLTQQYVTSTMLCSLYVCVAISAFVAFLTWLAAAMKFRWISPFYQLGSPAWDFTKSWTSTTTLASAAITAALTLSALPELTKYASRSGYAALAMLISLAVVVAPFVFVAFRTGAIGKDPATGNDMVIYTGCLWLFLVSGAITLFAGLAQIVVLFLLLDEIFLEYDFWSFSSNHGPWLALNVGSVSTGALAVALCWYVGQSMFLIIMLQREADASAAVNNGSVASDKEHEITRKATERAGAAAKARAAPPRTWPVL